VRSYAPNKTFLKFERIEARSKQNGLQTAFLIYGSDHRLDNVRGLPLLAACLETAKKMERYKEAVLGSAEEISKMVYQVVHQVYSDGSNPLGDRIAQASGFDTDKPELTRDAAGNKVASTVAASTNKQTVNMPVGAELKAVVNNNPLMFRDFYAVNTDLLCATVGIPPNVAMSKYDDSFSASRAAIKDWEHTLQVERDNFAFEFYEPIYAFWLEISVLQNKIQAPGYLKAKLEKNTMVLDAYRKTRWVGSQVPHIDPEKEVKAERLKLGDTAAAIPLTTVEASTEALNGGESEANMVQFSKELGRSKALGIKVEVPPPAIPPGNTPNKK
jgi:capsid protein